MPEIPKIKLPGPPGPPKLPDPAGPLRFIRQLISNTKSAMESAKKGVRDLGEEVKKPFDRY
jgi:hypothetical protein